MEERSPVPGEEGMAALPEDVGGSGISARRRTPGPLAATRAVPTPPEGASLTSRHAEGGLAGEHAREKVEEGTPARPVSRGSRRQGLSRGGDAVVEHGSLGSRKRTLGAVEEEAMLEGKDAIVVQAEAVPALGPRGDGMRLTSSHLLRPREARPSDDGLSRAA